MASDEDSIQTKLSTGNQMHIDHLLGEKAKGKPKEETLAVTKPPPDKPLVKVADEKNSELNESDINALDAKEYRASDPNEFVLGKVNQAQGEKVRVVQEPNVDLVPPPMEHIQVEISHPPAYAKLFARPVASEVKKRKENKIQDLENGRDFVETLDEVVKVDQDGKVWVTRTWTRYINERYILRKEITCDGKLIESSQETPMKDKKISLFEESWRTVFPKGLQPLKHQIEDIFPEKVLTGFIFKFPPKKIHIP